ncbi:hypothetical protein PF005_g22940 [Phytophthora fragariae]|uniref:Myb/SANT-like domain-containing protein n=1 Tax=Phytophthora fragariae TaxID=53985 RepID=A0A6A4A7D7_9STRA|nr:hypothetical protein PF003_g20660 [Phytophthora fragariae]KAE8946035.1 hypothetical protein PF009_g4316 [Phytophthora fragariae]KAE9131653.1 hypothetical protein PF007_g4027 [Phytophthora fragariae]KAE9152384.1 hypothetical protein PF006_g3378 [Phytophthora fragariae]KAE9181304.1 hypothetical protein PF005_g22940 [Phytophthora fragariae]
MSTPSPDTSPAAGPSPPVVATGLKPPLLAWSNRRLKTLLHLRIVTYGAAFLRQNARAQLTRLWQKIRRTFNKKHGLAASLDQIKNKYNSVKTLFGQIKAAEAATGNSETSINYPSYWEVLVQYFGDKKGLRNQDFGQSGVALPEFPGAPPDSEVSDDAVRVSSVEHQAGGEIEAVLGELSDEDDSHEDDLDDLDDDDSGDAGDAAAVVEAGRHEAMRNKRKLDLPEALVTMGSTLAAALAAPEHTSELAGVSTQLAKIQKTQELIVSAIEESRKVNAALLAFLSNTTPQ